MSGGASAIRGFVLQTLTIILDALANDDSWTAIRLEPSGGDEKADVIWYNETQVVKVVQVKSSQVQISMPDARRWADALRAIESNAGKFELQLIGPCASSLSQGCKHGDVDVLPPMNLNVQVMHESAALRLGAYLRRRNYCSLPPDICELLVLSLSSKLLQYSTTSEKVEKVDFQEQLIKWVLEIVPTAYEVKMYARCEVVCGVVGIAVLAGQKSIAKKGYHIYLPMEFANLSVSPSIVETVALRVTRTGDSPLVFVPEFIIDPSAISVTENSISSETVCGRFASFIVPGNMVIQKALTFRVEPPHDDEIPFMPGQFSFEVFVKYRHEEIPVKTLSLMRRVSNESNKLSYNGGAILWYYADTPNLPDIE